MNLEDYTADSICRAMALAGFVEDAWLRPKVSVLRVVLTPSFDEEVTITLVEEAADVTLSVRALKQKFWTEGAPRTILPFHEAKCAFGYGLFQEAAGLATQARLESERQSGICLDGMGMEACLVACEAVRTFGVNVMAGGAALELARKLIDWAWAELNDPHVRNALAHCGAYVGREYSLKKVPAPNRVTRLGVLGAVEDRAEFLKRVSTILSGDSHPPAQ